MEKQAKFAEDEVREELTHAAAGTVSMSHYKNQPHTNASSFFITLKPLLTELDGRFTVFAKVAEGLDVLRRMEQLR